MKNKTTIIIVDDHVLIAETWATLIGLDPRFSVVKVYDNTQTMLDEIAAVRPDIVILDINVFPISGFDAVEPILKFSPSSRIIAVSMHNQLSFAKRMIAKGAKGYVTKNSPKDEMYLAIEEVMQGRTYICKEISSKFADAFMTDDESSRLQTLTQREMEIIKLLKSGLTTDEIAAKLYLSPRTVDTHRGKILKKLGLKNSISLIKLINEHFPDL